MPVPSVFVIVRSGAATIVVIVASPAATVSGSSVWPVSEEFQPTVPCV